MDKNFYDNIDIDYKYNYNISLVKLSIKNNNEVIKCVNSLGQAIEYGCNGYIIQTKHPQSFLSLLEHKLKNSQNRQNPRILFIPDKLHINRKISPKFIKHYMTKYVPDILLLKIKNETDFYNATELFFEFFTIHWMKGGLKLLETCQINNCDIIKMDLYPDKLHDLEGHELRISTLIYSPFSILDSNNTLDGIDIRICKEFVRIHNATERFTLNDKRWGYILPNGSTEGTVADGEADIGAAGIFMWYEFYNYLQYTIPYLRSGVTCLVPKAQILPHWMLPGLPFSISTWIVLIISLFLSVAVMYTFHRISHSLVVEHQEMTIGDYVVKTIGLLTSQTISHTHFRPPYRQLLTWFHIYYFLITVYYATGLASLLTLPRYEKQINTVEDLADSDLQWGGDHISWIYAIAYAEDNYFKNLKSNFLVQTYNELEMRSTTRDYAFCIERLSGGDFAIGDYITEKALDYLIVMEKDLYFQQCGLAVNKLSPYLEKLNHMTLRLTNGGIIHYWESQVVLLHLPMNVQTGIKPGINNQPSSIPVPLKIKHLNGAFILLLTGLSMGMLTFTLEILIFKFKNRKLVKKEI